MGIPSIPETPGQIRRLLQERGLRPKKRFGQNFLADPNLRDSMIREAGLEPGEQVLEVGPGLGTLTRGLLDAGARVVAVERDERLVQFLEEAFAGEERLTLVSADVLRKRELSPEVRDALEGRFSVVSNLPYSVVSPLLAALAREPEPPKRILVMVQFELGLRMSAGPGSKDYGPLSVLLALRGKCRIVREIGGQVYVPRTKVRSAIVDFVPRPGDRGRILAADRLARQAFRYRRKTLFRALRMSGHDSGRISEALAALGLEPALRPEVIEPERFADLALRLGVTPEEH